MKSWLMTTALLSTCLVPFDLTAAAPTPPASSGTASVVHFRLAASEPVKGFRATKTAACDPLYIDSRTALAGDDAVWVRTLDRDTYSAIVMTLTEHAALRFAKLLRVEEADRLAIFQTGSLAACGSLFFDPSLRRLVISELGTPQAERLAGILRGGVDPAGTVITLVPAQPAVRPGGVVRVDVFVSGVLDLRGYELSLRVGGGDHGRVALETMSIDRQRTDYIYGALPKLDAIDSEGGRLGAALLAGGVDANREAYLATFIFRASATAAGGFIITLDTAGLASLLIDSHNAYIPFSGGKTVVSVRNGASARPSEGA